MQLIFSLTTLTSLLLTMAVATDPEFWDDTRSYKLLSGHEWAESSFFRIVQ